LIVRALRLVWRRFPLYCAAVAVTIGAQALVVFGWHGTHALEYASFTIPPLLTTLVYAFAWADVKPEPTPAPAIWERILERSWAVIAIDLVTTIVTSFGLGSLLSADPIDILAGIGILGLSATLIFADVSATVDAMPWWWILLGSFWRSVRATWQGPTLFRALTLVALELLVFGMQLTLQGWLTTLHVAKAEFWSQVPLSALTVPPLAALTMLVYHDATGSQADAGEKAS
jgi:hypothetical protein